MKIGEKSCIALLAHHKTSKYKACGGIMRNLCVMALLLPSVCFGDNTFGHGSFYLSAAHSKHYAGAFADIIPNERHHAIVYEWRDYEAGIIDRNSQREPSVFAAYKRKFNKRILRLDTGFRIAVASGYVDSIQPDNPSEDADNDGKEKVDGAPLGLLVQPSVFLSKGYKSFRGEAHVSIGLVAAVLKLNL